MGRTSNPALTLFRVLPPLSGGRSLWRSTTDTPTIRHEGHEEKDREGRRPALPATRLQEPAFGEAHDFTAGDDEMVQDANPDRLEGTDELAGNQLVGGGDLGDSA